MIYDDEMKKLRQEAQADAQAAEARIENQEKLRNEQERTLETQREKLSSQKVREKEIEIDRVQSDISSMEIKERRAGRELGIKRGSRKPSDIRAIKREAGTLRKKSQNERHIEHLKKQLGEMKSNQNIRGSSMRPPGGGLIR